jgi:probable HAF family extracellular repeat protein
MKNKNASAFQGRLSIVLHAACLALASGGGAARAGTLAQPLDLGTLGGNESRADAISSTGQVIGVASRPSASFRHAFSWTQAGGMVDLTTPFTTARDSHVIAVNDSGRVFGNFFNTSGKYRAFTWIAANGAVELGTLNGADSLIQSVSSTGQAVGRSGNNGFSWTAAGGLVNLGTFSAGLPVTNPNAVSNAGHVVGYVGDGTAEKARAFVWTAAGGLVDLGGAIPGQSETDGCTATDVNDSGQVVGSCGQSGGRRGFYWSPSTGMIDLGGTALLPRFINNAGQVVGYGASNAFYWTIAGGLRDLGRFDGWVTEPTALSENGLLTGIAVPVGSTRTFVSQDGGPLQAASLSPADPSSPSAVNSIGHIVGNSTLPGSVRRGFYWSPATGAIELPPLGGSTVSQANALNASGQVVGKYHASGQERAVLWTLLSDTDNDGIADAEDADDDGDGLPDELENALGLNPLSSSDAASDLDSDGLSNLAEYQRGTRLDDADTDRDGLNDGDEVARGRNPTVNETAILIPVFELLSN